MVLWKATFFSQRARRFVSVQNLAGMQHSEARASASSFARPAGDTFELSPRVAVHVDRVQRQVRDRQQIMRICRAILRSMPDPGRAVIRNQRVFDRLIFRALLIPLTNFHPSHQGPSHSRWGSEKIDPSFPPTDVSPSLTGCRRSMNPRS